MGTKNVKVGQHKLIKFLLSVDVDKFNSIIPSVPDKVLMALSALESIKNSATESEIESCINLLPDDAIKLSIPSEIEKELFNGEEFKQPKLVKMIEDYFNYDENRTHILFILDDDESGEEVTTHCLYRQEDVEEKLHWLLLKAHQTGRNSKYLYYSVFDDIGEDILFESMNVREMLWSLKFE